MRKRAYSYTLAQNYKQQRLLFRQKRSRKKTIKLQNATQHDFGPIKHATKNIIEIDVTNLGCKQHQNVQIYPAIDNTFILVCHYKNEEQGILHVGTIKKQREAQNETQSSTESNAESKQEGEGEQHQILKQLRQNYKFNVNMLSDHEVLIFQKEAKKQNNYTLRMRLWNLIDNTILNYQYDTNKRLLQACVEVFPETHLICICFVFKNQWRPIQNIYVTYYNLQPDKQLKLIISHQITRPYSQNWKSYKINKQQGLIFVNQIWDKKYQDNNYEYTICNTKSCTTMNILPLPKINKYVYFPLMIVEINQGILFIKFKIQPKVQRKTKIKMRENSNGQIYQTQQIYSMKFEQQQIRQYSELFNAHFNKKQLPQYSFYWDGDQLVCIYGILWNYKTNEISNNRLLNSNENIQFTNFVKMPEHANLYDKNWKKFNTTFVDPKSLKIVEKYVEHEQYDSFWNSDYDQLSYFQYKGGIQKNLTANIQTIKLQTKLTKLNIFRLLDSKTLMAWILLQLQKSIDDDLLSETTNILSYQENKKQVRQ